MKGAFNDDLQENSRWGATLAQTLERDNSVKVYFNSGLSARTGTNFNAVGVAWQYRWGAGLGLAWSKKRRIRAATYR